MENEKPNIILTKSYNFSLQIVKLYFHIREKHKEFEISKQLLKSGTSIGANAEEAVGGFSKKDFIAKFQISYKEARETKYWLRLLRDSKLLEKDKADLMINDVDELLRIITAILNSSKK